MEYISSEHRNEYWYSRTDGKPICYDCIYYQLYNGKCVMGINGGTAKYPISCNKYKSDK
jgi:hypothetical protein